MNYTVLNVQPLPDYLLHLTFKSGEEKIFDMKPYLGIGVFKALKDEHIFRTVRVSFDTVEWENEIDIDPETLYNESHEI